MCVFQAARIVQGPSMSIKLLSRRSLRSLDFLSLQQPCHRRHRSLRNAMRHGIRITYFLYQPTFIFFLKQPHLHH
ncbi:hypothetical protein HBI57_208080 [Parastagonospora nodorum]|nr:hypothetical protein HBI57_208080 [Parastagonospora nodorum]KAH6467288.1 hypothetical protein HBI58_170180 [Parastagonospora nodorum]